MAAEPGPTLADDEAALARYAESLADAFEDVALQWLQRLVDRRAPGMGTMPPVRAKLVSGATRAGQELRDLLASDISEQTVGPLEILRRAIRFATDVLSDADVAPVARDDFSRSKFPNDVYDLAPASFADVDPSLHEPGFTWGAAKAHVHLRRRREAADPDRIVVALSADLMDRSKISAAYPDAVIVRSVDKLIEVATQASVVLVDLNRVQDMAALAGVGDRLVAFGSHVDDAALAAAEAAGAEALPRSVFFRRLENREFS